MSATRVKDIQQKDERTLWIQWSDNREQQWDVVNLRRSCPCAVCIDEWTGKKTLKDDDVSDTVRPVSIKSVGRYALSIEFSDGHKTGIYTFEKLQEWA